MGVKEISVVVDAATRIGLRGDLPGAARAAAACGPPARDRGPSS
jgi:hypothetical protein